MSDSRRLVDKLWSYCNVLRDDGVGVIEYTEQLTYLLFLKMAHERATRRLNPQQIVPPEYSWQKLLDAEGTELEVTYTEPGLQGDRSTGGSKPATVETGAEIAVPLFITTGEKVKVDTRDGSYLGRVSG